MTWWHKKINLNKVTDFFQFFVIIRVTQGIPLHVHKVGNLNYTVFVFGFRDGQTDRVWRWIGFRQMNQTLKWPPPWPGCYPKSQNIFHDDIEFLPWQEGGGRGMPDGGEYIPWHRPCFHNTCTSNTMASIDVFTFIHPFSTCTEEYMSRTTHETSRFGDTRSESSGHSVQKYILWNTTDEAVSEKLHFH